MTTEIKLPTLLFKDWNSPPHLLYLQIYKTDPFSNKTQIVSSLIWHFSMPLDFKKSNDLFKYYYGKHSVIKIFPKKLPQQWLKQGASLFIKTSQCVCSSTTFLTSLSNEDAYLKLFFYYKISEFMFLIEIQLSKYYKDKLEHSLYGSATIWFFSCC